MATFTPGQVLTAAQMNQIGDDSGWITISSFSNSWVAGSIAPAYRKVGNRVQLRGRVTSGTANVTAFTLPAGYRPQTNQSLCAISSTGSINQVSIDTSGNVGPLLSVITSLDDISFYID
jgi:hypothetical protein